MHQVLPSDLFDNPNGGHSPEKVTESHPKGHPGGTWHRLVRKLLFEANIFAKNNIGVGVGYPSG